MHTNAEIVRQDQAVHELWHAPDGLLSGCQRSLPACARPPQGNLAVRDRTTQATVGGFPTRVHSGSLFPGATAGTYPP
jgi:hypothetical protein